MIGNNEIIALTALSMHHSQGEFSLLLPVGPDYPDLHCFRVKDNCVDTYTWKYNRYTLVVAW